MYDDTLWIDGEGRRNHWKGRVCKVYSKVGQDWKMTNAHRRLGLRNEGLVRETEVAFRRIVEILGRHMTRRGGGHR